MRRLLSIFAVAVLFSGTQGYAQSTSKTPVKNLYPTGDLNGLFNSIGGFSSTINAVGLGGPNSLETVPTVGVVVPVVRSFINSGNGTGDLQVWVLTASTAANDFGHRRPADFNSSTNAKVWVLSGTAVFTGNQANGVHLIWQVPEQFNGQGAALSLQGFGQLNGIFVHTTGQQGIPIIGQSDSGASAAKFYQYGLFDSPALMVWRNAGGGSADGPLLSMKNVGNSDYIRLTLNGVEVAFVDINGAVHPPHLTDSAAQNDSTYFSTTQGKLSYKDSGGIVHALY